jgi:copper chaperone CopZ
MIHQSLQLASTLDVNGVSTVLKAMRRLPGVDSVEAFPGFSTIDVRFDQDLTSLQEMRATLANVGHPEKTRRHAEGSCCGSCGG